MSMTLITLIRNVAFIFCQSIQRLTIVKITNVNTGLTAFYSSYFMSFN